eukprot:ctg_609.g275
MRDFVESLLSDKKYRPFWQPVQERDAPDYHEIVQQPMDLSRLLQHIDDRRIQTLSELVAAFELIAQNALAYNSQREERGLRIRSKATALVDLVHRWADLVTDPEENEHESEVIRQCEAIVQRRRAETIQQAEQRRRTRSSGDAGVLSFEEAAALERAARCVYRNRERVVAEERQDEGEDAVSSDVDRQRAEAEAARRRRRGEDTAAMTTVVSDAPTEGDYIGGADEGGATRTMEAAAAPPPDAELSAMLPLTEPSACPRKNISSRWLTQRCTSPRVAALRRCCVGARSCRIGCTRDTPRARTAWPFWRACSVGSSSAMRMRWREGRKVASGA